MANNLKQYDAFQVLRSVFDIDKNCLRVCVVDGASGGGPIEVIIDHTSDSIRLGDGTTLTTGTNVSGKQGQDVYVINDELDIRSLDALIDNVAIHDADGDELAINPDGSINTAQALNPNLTGKNAYSEVLSIASSIETTIISHTALAGRETFLQNISVSGENIATYKVKVNGVVVDQKRTHFGAGLNEEFIFNGENNSGIAVPVGQTVTVTVEHSRPMTADFNSKILYMESI